MLEYIPITSQGDLNLSDAFLFGNIEPFSLSGHLEDPFHCFELLLSHQRLPSSFLHALATWSRKNAKREATITARRLCTLRKAAEWWKKHSDPPSLIIAVLMPAVNHQHIGVLLYVSICLSIALRAVLPWGCDHHLQYGGLMFDGGVYLTTIHGGKYM